MSQAVTEAFEERQVILRVLAGEQDEFRHIVMRYQNKIYGLIRRQVPHDEAARELAQITMVRAYTNLNKFRFESRFSTWLTRIALNVVAGYFSSRAYKVWLNSDSIVETAIQHSSDAETMLAQKQAMQQLQRGLSRLTAKYREALVLYSFEDKSYEETAEILGVPVGTVCSRIDTARRLLRKHMKQVSA